MFSLWFFVGNRHTRQGNGFGCDLLIRDANSDAHRGRASGVTEVAVDGTVCAARRRGMGTVALGSGQPRPCGVRTRDGRSLVCVLFNNSRWRHGFFPFFLFCCCFKVTSSLAF